MLKIVSQFSRTGPDGTPGPAKQSEAYVNRVFRSEARARIAGYPLIQESEQTSAAAGPVQNQRILLKARQVFVRQKLPPPPAELPPRRAASQPAASPGIAEASAVDELVSLPDHDENFKDIKKQKSRENRGRTSLVITSRRTRPPRAKPNARLGVPAVQATPLVDIEAQLDALDDISKSAQEAEALEAMHRRNRARAGNLARRGWCSDVLSCGMQGDYDKYKMDSYYPLASQCLLYFGDLGSCLIHSQRSVRRVTGQPHGGTSTGACRACKEHAESCGSLLQTSSGTLPTSCIQCRHNCLDPSDFAQLGLGAAGSIRMRTAIACILVSVWIVCAPLLASYSLGSSWPLVSERYDWAALKTGTGAPSQLARLDYPMARFSAADLAAATEWNDAIARSSSSSAGGDMQSFVQACASNAMPSRAHAQMKQVTVSNAASFTVSISGGIVVLLFAVLAIVLRAMCNRRSEMDRSFNESDCAAVQPGRHDDRLQRMRVQGTCLDPTTPLGAAYVSNPDDDIVAASCSALATTSRPYVEAQDYAVLISGLSPGVGVGALRRRIARATGCGVHQLVLLHRESTTAAECIERVELATRAQILAGMSGFKTSRHRLRTKLARRSGPTPTNGEQQIAKVARAFQGTQVPEMKKTAESSSERKSGLATLAEGLAGLWQSDEIRVAMAHRQQSAVTQELKACEAELSLAVQRSPAGRGAVLRRATAGLVSMHGVAAEPQQRPSTAAALLQASSVQLDRPRPNMPSPLLLKDVRMLASGSDAGIGADALVPERQTVTSARVDLGQLATQVPLLNAEGNWDNKGQAHRGLAAFGGQLSEMASQATDFLVEQEELTSSGASSTSSDDSDQEQQPASQGKPSRLYARNTINSSSILSGGPSSRHSVGHSVSGLGERDRDAIAESSRSLAWEGAVSALGLSSLLGCGPQTVQAVVCFDSPIGAQRAMELADLGMSAVLVGRSSTVSGRHPTVTPAPGPPHSIMWKHVDGVHRYTYVRGCFHAICLPLCPGSNARITGEDRRSAEARINTSMVSLGLQRAKQGRQTEKAGVNALVSVNSEESDWAGAPAVTSLTRCEAVTGHVEQWAHPCSLVLLVLTASFIALQSSFRAFGLPADALRAWIADGSPPGLLGCGVAPELHATVIRVLATDPLWASIPATTNLTCLAEDLVADRAQSTEALLGTLVPWEVGGSQLDACDQLAAIRTKQYQWPFKAAAIVVALPIVADWLSASTFVGTWRQHRTRAVAAVSVCAMAFAGVGSLLLAHIDFAGAADDSARNEGVEQSTLGFLDRWGSGILRDATAVGLRSYLSCLATMLLWVAGLDALWSILPMMWQIIRHSSCSVDPASGCVEECMQCSWVSGAATYPGIAAVNEAAADEPIRVETEDDDPKSSGSANLVDGSHPKQLKSIPSAARRVTRTKQVVAAEVLSNMKPTKAGVKRRTPVAVASPVLHQDTKHQSYRKARRTKLVLQAWLDDNDRFGGTVSSVAPAATVPRRDSPAYESSRNGNGAAQLALEEDKSRDTSGISQDAGKSNEQRDENGMSRLQVQTGGELVVRGGAGKYSSLDLSKTSDANQHSSSIVELVRESREPSSDSQVVSPTPSSHHDSDISSSSDTHQSSNTPDDRTTLPNSTKLGDEGGATPSSTSGACPLPDRGTAAVCHLRAADTCLPLWFHLLDDDLGGASYVEHVIYPRLSRAFSSQARRATVIAFLLFASVAHATLHPMLLLIPAAHLLFTTSVDSVRILHDSRGWKRWSDMVWWPVAVAAGKLARAVEAQAGRLGHRDMYKIFVGARDQRGQNVKAMQSKARAAAAMAGGVSSLGPIGVAQHEQESTVPSAGLHPRDERVVLASEGAQSLSQAMEYRECLVDDVVAQSPPLAGTKTAQQAAGGTGPGTAAGTGMGTSSIAEHGPADPQTNGLTEKQTVKAHASNQTGNTAEVQPPRPHQHPDSWSPHLLDLQAVPDHAADAQAAVDLDGEACLISGAILAGAVCNAIALVIHTSHVLAMPSSGFITEGPSEEGGDATGENRQGSASSAYLHWQTLYPWRLAQPHVLLSVLLGSAACIVALSAVASWACCPAGLRCCSQRAQEAEQSAKSSSVGVASGRRVFGSAVSRIDDPSNVANARDPSLRLCVADALGMVRGISSYLPQDSAALRAMYPVQSDEQIKKVHSSLSGAATVFDLPDRASKRENEKQMGKVLRALVDPGAFARDDTIESSSDGSD